MNSDLNTNQAVSKATQGLRYLCVAAAALIVIARFYRGQYAQAVQSLLFFAIVLLSVRGSERLATKDSWARILGAGLFVVAAAVLVTALILWLGL